MSSDAASSDAAAAAGGAGRAGATVHAAGGSIADAVVEPPVVPAYGPGTLGALLPGAAAALGAPTSLDAMALPQASAVCLVLIDGLGAELLAEAADDAPFLAGLAAAPRPAGCPEVLRVGCPTTTATSMGSFGTGLVPGRHGLVGYQVRDPDRGVMLNELRWDPYTDPRRWQPHPTVFGHLDAAGVAVTRVGAPEFAGSGLTVATQRGGQFVGAKTLADRVDASVTALAAARPALVYLYWGTVDSTGHESGWRSPQWRAALRATDSELARLAAQLPAGTLLAVTADHGMVDVSHTERLDLAARPELRSGIAVLAGEPRMRHLYCRHGRVAEVADRISAAVGDRAWVRTREQAIADGWFGPVDERVRGRIGDILVAARGTFSVVDSDVMRDKALALIGHHGSLTEAEQLVPLIVLQA